MLLHTQSIVCATVDSQCLEYLGYITLTGSTIYVPFHLCIKQNLFLFSNFLLHSLTKRQILQKKRTPGNWNESANILFACYLFNSEESKYFREAFF